MVPPTLNITNGDSARTVMQAAGVSGEILPWRDVLHEGPAPENLPLDRFSEVRARFIIAQGWGDPDRVRQSFAQRDRVITDIDRYQRVVLWFEHDLYDQLQLLQILHWLCDHCPRSMRVGLVCTDQYLGTLSGAELARLHDHEQAVTTAQFSLARVAWDAFCAPDPLAWSHLTRTDTTCLPYLGDAVVRHLQQFPAPRTGLNRTERQLLQAVVGGVDRPAAIFVANQEADGVRFMGDTVFWTYLDRMLDSDPPLLQRTGDGRVYPCTAASEVLAGDCDWARMWPRHKWLGGVKLSRANLWRWDDTRARLRAPD